MSPLFMEHFAVLPKGNFFAPIQSKQEASCFYARSESDSNILVTKTIRKPGWQAFRLVVFQILVPC